MAQHTTSRALQIDLYSFENEASNRITFGPKLEWPLSLGIA